SVGVADEMEAGSEGSTSALQPEGEDEHVGLLEALHPGAVDADAESGGGAYRAVVGAPEQEGEEVGAVALEADGVVGGRQSRAEAKCGRERSILRGEEGGRGDEVVSGIGAMSIGGGEDLRERRVEAVALGEEASHGSGALQNEATGAPEESELSRLDEPALTTGQRGALTGQPTGADFRGDGDVVVESLPAERLVRPKLRAQRGGEEEK